MDRLNAYCSSDGNGGVKVDVEGIIVDLITLYKASGNSKDNLITQIEELWPEVHVSISIPSKAKN